MFTRGYADVFAGDERWRSLPTPTGKVFEWDTDSTYVRKPPYFDGMPATPAPVRDIAGARVLAKLGDSVTTDHISPAGNIKAGTPAAQYLTEHGVSRKDFNSYGSRRGNHEVMIRGTFANIRLRNQLLDDVEGGYTRNFLADGEQTFIYDASAAYQAAGIPLVILAGAEYGSGSSRDWAAKGTALLGVKAVIARVLRAHPPVEPDRHGRHPAAVPGRRIRRFARADRHRDVRHRPASTALNDGTDAEVGHGHRDPGGRGGGADRVPGQGPHRHPR